MPTEALELIAEEAEGAAGTKRVRFARRPDTQLALGMASGMTEVCLLQPTVAVKNAWQQGRALSLSPSFLYRGLAVNCASYGPITAVQFGVDRFVDQTFVTAAMRRDAPVTAQLGCAAVCGVASALIAGPAELVMTQQQRTGAALGAQTRALVSEHGAAVLARGFGTCAARDGLYAVGYLGVHPLVEGAVRRDLGMEQPATFAVAGLVSGVLTAAVTQPFDTLKTVVQGKLVGVRDALRDVTSRGGVSMLWAGLAPRTARIVAATYILVGIKSKVTEMLLAVDAP